MGFLATGSVYVSERQGNTNIALRDFRTSQRVRQGNKPHSHSVAGYLTEAYSQKYFLSICKYRISFEHKIDSF